MSIVVGLSANLCSRWVVAREAWADRDIVDDGGAETKGGLTGRPQHLELDIK